MASSSSMPMDKLNVAQIESVYRRYGERIFSLCLRLLANMREAELATVDVFVQFGRRLTTRWDESRTQMYLRELAIDASLAHLHKHDDRAAAREALLPAAMVPPHRRGEQEATRIEPQTLEALIARLPDNERVAYVLHDVERESEEFIAAHLGVSEAETRRYIRNARLELQRLWRSQ
jgi:RNA polymerase sigma-70 factor (ECF subfamily)